MNTEVMETLATLEAVKSVGEVHSPVAGEVLEVNDRQRCSWLGVDMWIGWRERGREICPERVLRVDLKDVKSQTRLNSILL